ncbi:MAG: KH domain-containing protein [Candidatus Eremiobacteraeota bacterium]|nr:KH domain-containing protein [Candidatus Eremiobacteraeota bacterium]MBV8366629.1 KH domain-containing protein [Candidatus Eremiobacteraeota bacterium]
MPDRPPEFTDIDLDEEDDEDTPKPPADADEPREFDDDADVDGDEDEEDDDFDGDSDPGDDVESDKGSTPAAAPARSDYAGEGDERDEDEDVRDGVQRAAAVLKYIVEHIVDEPQQISIGATEDDRGPVLLLRVAEEDRGKVIGRQGRIVQAIRTVVKAATVGTGEKVSVEIID